MLPNSRLFTSITWFVLSSVISTLSLADDARRPAQGEYDLKEIKMKSFEPYYGNAEWLITSDKGSILFAVEENEDFQESLVSYKLLPNGKTSSQFIWLKNKGDISSVEALWLGDTGDSTPAGKKAGGLLIVAYTTYTSTGFGGEFILATAMFDADGKKVGGWNILEKAELDNEQYVSVCRMQACRVDDTIGFAVSIVFNEQSSALCGTKESALEFYELDLDGKIIGEPTELPQPKKGQLQMAWVRGVVWNGARWLVCLHNIKNKKHWKFGYWGTTPIDNEVRVIAVWGAPSSRKAKNYKIENDKEPYGFYYPVQLLPAPNSTKHSTDTTKAQGESKYLFFVHEGEISFYDIRLDQYRYEGGIYEIDWRGKRKGSKKTVKIPKPEHSFTYDPFKKIIMWWRPFSNLIPTSESGSISVSTTANNSLYYLASSASMSYGTGWPGETEQRLYLYSLDIERGKIKTLIQTDDLNIDLTFFLGSTLRWFNGQVSVINTSLEYAGNLIGFKSYFSVLDP